MRFLQACALLAAMPLVAGAAQPADAARILARMREAIGGDALATVKSFSVKGSETWQTGKKTGKRDVEWVYASPDRFLQVHSYKGFLINVTFAIGFKGDDLIRHPRPKGTREAAEPRLNPAVVVPMIKRAFSRWVIPMLGITPIYPYDAMYSGEETLDNRAVHALALQAPDGFRMRLHVDAVTHLPVMISWSEKLEHRLYFREFKTAGGLTWPHRMQEMAGGEILWDTRLGRFKINPKIDPRYFQP